MSAYEPRWYVDVTYGQPDRAVQQRETFGPFYDRALAEQTVVALAARLDVVSAHVRNPDGGE